MLLTILWIDKRDKQDNYFKGADASWPHKFMSLRLKYFNNTRKPKGILGKAMIVRMNRHHTPLVSWALSHFPNDDINTILDIGCGGGKNALELLKLYKNAHLTAVDYSKVSVNNSRKMLRCEIKNNRCEVLEQDVMNLTLEKDNFDLITAFETVYFWPDLEISFKNVLDCLKRGGKFIITHEADGITHNQWDGVLDGLTIYTADELKEKLLSVGFSSVESFHHENNPWIVVIGTK